jgi:hypothetical protein
VSPAGLGQAGTTKAAFRLSVFDSVFARRAFSKKTQRTEVYVFLAFSKSFYQHWQ